MIKYIHIENFLLIQKMSMAISPKFTVFTGESGSGKSLVFKALRFCLGQKVDKSYIGQWQDTAVVIIDCHMPVALKPVMQDKGIIGPDIKIKQTLSLDKRICEINGKKVSQAFIKEIATHLILDSQQGSAYAIKDSIFQKDYIDGLVDKSVLNNFYQLESQYKELRAKDAELEKILNTYDEEWLQHQVEELSESMVMDYHECQQILSQHKLIQQAEKDWQTESGQLNTIRKIINRMGKLESVDINAPIEIIEEAIDQIEESFKSVLSEGDQKQLLDKAKVTMDLYQDLSRKHRVLPSELQSLYQRYLEQLEAINYAKSNQHLVKEAIKTINLSLASQAKLVMKHRYHQSRLLSEDITQKMVLMGMEHAILKISFEKEGDCGLERPIFEVKSNPGQDFKQIQDCLSGGELSRLSLLLTLYTHQQTTLILDEIDAGVSGKVGLKMKSLIASISEKQQVLCISHLAQVASGAEAHCIVSKQTYQNVTVSTVSEISGRQRLEELSRLMCGHAKMFDEAKRLLSEPA